MDGFFLGFFFCGLRGCFIFNLFIFVQRAETSFHRFLGYNHLKTKLSIVLSHDWCPYKHLTAVICTQFDMNMFIMCRVKFGLCPCIINYLLLWIILQSSYTTEGVWPLPQTFYSSMVRYELKPQSFHFGYRRQSAAQRGCSILDAAFERYFALIFSNNTAGECVVWWEIGYFTILVLPVCLFSLCHQCQSQSHAGTTAKRLKLYEKQLLFTVGICICCRNSTL